MFEPEIFWRQVYSIEECTRDIIGTFRRHLQSFGARRSDSAREELFPPFPPLYAPA